MNMTMPRGRKGRWHESTDRNSCGIGAKSEREMACGLALIYREGDGERSTDRGREVETRANRAGERDNRNARWGWKEGFLFRSTVGLGWHAIKLNVILQATTVHLDCERRVM